MSEYPFKTGEGSTTPVEASETQTTQENQQDTKFSITSAFSKVGFYFVNIIIIIIKAF